MANQIEYNELDTIKDILERLDYIELQNSLFRDILEVHNNTLFPELKDIP